MLLRHKPVLPAGECPALDELAHRLNFPCLCGAFVMHVEWLRAHGAGWSDICAHARVPTDRFADFTLKVSSEWRDFATRASYTYREE